MGLALRRAARGPPTRHRGDCRGSRAHGPPVPVPCVRERARAASSKHIIIDGTQRRRRARKGGRGPRRGAAAQRPAGGRGAGPLAPLAAPYRLFGGTSSLGAIMAGAQDRDHVAGVDGFPHSCRLRSAVVGLGHLGPFEILLNAAA